MTRILLVEDEKSLHTVIKMNLELEGYEVVLAIDGRDALDSFNNQRFDLIILDVMLPEIDGFELCERIRVKDTQTPILFLTAKDSSEDRIKGLKIGGDDYLAKPFNLEELLLRVSNLLKRKIFNELPNKVSLSLGDNKIDFSNYTATTFNGKKINLTNKEIKLLRLFASKPGEVVSRQEIMEKVWEYDVYPSTRTIDNFIVNLRKYFEKVPKKPVFFESVRGVGYRLNR